jgi:hypothetical protein
MSCVIQKQRRTLHLIALAASLALLVTGPAEARSQNPNPGIVPHQARYHGLTYGQWQARWQQWGLSIPANATHPFFPGGNVLQAQTDHVWFLAGVVGSREVRSITIPAGTALFFPVVNVECSTVEAAPFHGDSRASLSRCANGHIDHTSGLAATIDERPVRRLDSYRGESPLFTFGPLPDPNVIKVRAGTVGRSVDVGIYLLLKPLSVGKHTIHFTGTFDEFGVSIDTTYHITVAPQGG